MSDKVIRISSKQGFSDTWLNAGTPSNLNLLDFTIPRGYNVNLAESYVAINAQIDNDSAQPVNATMCFDARDGEFFNLPTSALIRNCRLENDRGLVESIRRVDTLKCAMHGLEHDAETRKNNLNTFAQYTNGRGVGNQTSYFLDCVTNNTSNDGATIDTTNTSRNIARDIKVPLNDIFGCCDTDAYSTDIFGETRIHLETNMINLKSRMLGGAENVSNSFDGATTWGKMETVMGVAAGAGATELESSVSYGDWQYTFPFFVGQSILVTGTAGAGPSPADAEVVISGIRYQTDNTAAPPTGTAKVFITTATPWYTNNQGGPVNVSAITIKSKIDQTLTNVVNRADLVLHLTNEQSPQSLQFETFSVQEDNGNSLTSFNKGYMLEPEAKAFIVAMCKNNTILPARICESYRYAIDNVEQTGNRDVSLPHNARPQGSPLYYERLQRCLEGQIGTTFRNAQLRYYRNDTTTQANAYDAIVSVIAETCETTQDSKMLNLNIECAQQLQKLILYKSITKTI